MSEGISKIELLELTTEVVAAHVSNNTVPVEQLPQLIKDVYATLTKMDGGDAKPERPQPAVSVKRSVTPDYLICLEDGKKLKMLKRHLMTRYGMTPEDYRDRWDLPSDYPMVAPNYAAHRSALAKKIGLGTKPRNAKK